ncbi:MAG TPA: peptidase M50 [Gammaproteobacteria bacterium]|nr:peptidase M50 [Gammaproteobacteria bacterium]
MADTISPWDLIAPLKPRLKEELSVAMQQHAGKNWYVVSDPFCGRHYRFSMAAGQLIEGMSGNSTVADICLSHADSAQLNAHRQGQVIRLLAQMHAAELLDWSLPAAARALLERLVPAAETHRVVNPLMVRLPLVDPDAWLDRAVPWVKPLFSPVTLMLWCMLVGWGLLQAAMHWSALTDNVADRVLTSSNLMLLWLSYPAVKLLHEFGHAFAVKVHGGEVHEMGIILLALVPVPYVDATSANAFVSQRWRVLVSMAGIMVDMLIASMALQLWLLAAPGGLLHALCYNIVLIAFLSTLLFNANPLMRFDGYYILSDMIGIPNLASRANRHLLYLLQRYAFGLKTLRSPAHGRYEAFWFMAYGIAAFVYRLFVLALILWFVSGKYLLLGLILAVWGGIVILLRPLLNGLRDLVSGPLLAPVRVRALLTSAAALLVVGLLVFVVPFPSWTQAEAVVWLPDNAVVRAGADGFVRDFLVSPGARVKEGTALVRSEDSLASVRLERLKARVEELQARYTALRGQDRAEAARVRDRLRSAEADLSRARAEYDRLVIFSEAAGHFEPRYGEDLLGRFVRKGETIGYITGAVQPRLRAVITQKDIGRVQSDVQHLQARLVEHSASLIPVRLIRVVPAAGRQLPSAALGTAGGGGVPVDPVDSSGRTALVGVFEVELALPPGIDAHPGARAWVRFYHSRAPLGQRWYEALRSKINQRLAEL